MLYLLKETEYSSYICGSEGAVLPDAIRLTPYEKRVRDRLAAAERRLMQRRREYDESRRAPTPPPADIRKREEALARLDAEGEKLTAHVKHLRDAFKGQPRARRHVRTLFSTKFQQSLGPLEPGTVVLHLLVADDGCRVLMVTSDGRYLDKHIRLENDELSKVFQLRAVIKMKGDYRGLASDLHDILIAPIESDLAAVDAHTLVVTLDGVLRYLPLSVLYDPHRNKEQHLIERYNLVVVTVESVRGRRSRQGSAQGVGFASGQAGTVNELPFQEVPKLHEQMCAAIDSGDDACGGITGAVPGLVYWDRKFTREQFFTSLRTHQNALVHVGGHFALNSGRPDASFIVLGDHTP